ncbi:hypothetical protein B0T26DRAFT_469812 [Lasiosphaeria miniovina]|uniref:Uncharacterized protein n=1 Tax=Lasiosphaeria miniovina TaxID=1954250 RepID=A0AA40DKN3_9PEZI|nr:uncharacterized protein B0T26DRAFT_469812 [Lasiosphaeria miniovina]KAK0706730.1 hypothetical protein B0T26DRAFT_469812 [Lasiosphaeria miniovina]
MPLPVCFLSLLPPFSDLFVCFSGRPIHRVEPSSRLFFLPLPLSPLSLSRDLVSVVPAVRHVATERPLWSPSPSLFRLVLPRRLPSSTTSQPASRTVPKTCRYLSTSWALPVFSVSPAQPHAIGSQLETSYLCFLRADCFTFLAPSQAQAAASAACLLLSSS